jgi:hypothetical protein
MTRATGTGGRYSTGPFSSPVPRPRPCPLPTHGSRPRHAGSSVRQALEYVRRFGAGELRAVPYRAVRPFGVPHPEPSLPENARNAYVFDRAVTFTNGDGTTSTGLADLYKRGHFVCETKQGVEKED